MELKLSYSLCRPHHLGIFVKVLVIMYSHTRQPDMIHENIHLLYHGPRHPCLAHDISFHCKCLFYFSQQVSYQQCLGLVSLTTSHSLFPSPASAAPIPSSAPVVIITILPVSLSYENLIVHVMMKSVSTVVHSSTNTRKMMKGLNIR